MFLCDNRQKFWTILIKQIFRKTETFQKTGVLFFSWKLKIENALFPYKTAILSEANVKTNRMVSTKWTYRKEWSFASNYFIFLKILFQFKNLF